MMPCLCFVTLSHDALSSNHFSNHVYEKERADCFTLTVFLSSNHFSNHDCFTLTVCLCFVTLSHDALSSNHFSNHVYEKERADCFTLTVLSVFVL